MSRKKLQQLLSLPGNDSRIAIFTHANPDPDSIASAAVLRYILMKKKNRRPPIIYDGIIGWAENRTMVELLEIPVTPIADTVQSEYDFRVIVDCQPASGNSR